VCLVLVSVRVSGCHAGIVCMKAVRKATVGHVSLCIRQVVSGSVYKIC
jgi:hypothetical protein